MKRLAQTLGTRTAAALVGLGLGLALWLPGTGANAQTEAPGDAAAWIAAGRALYRGDVPWQRPPTLHGVALAAGTQACAACHGARGEARTEAGVAVPSVQWQRLAQASAARPAYADAAQLLRALDPGRASDGRALSAPMPRFALTRDEQRALLAYLRVLGTEADPVPGVDAQRIVLGSVLPLDGAQAATGHRIRDALLARIARVNAAGGIFGRQLALIAVDAGPDAASASAAAIALVQSDRVFALVASLLPAPDAALRAVLAQHDTAMVATLGVPVTTPAPEPLVTWLLPSLALQTRELADELQRTCPATPGQAPAIRVLHRDDVAAQSLRAALADAPGLPPMAWQAVPDADGLRRILRQPATATPTTPTTPTTRTIALLPPSLADIAREALHDSGHCLGTLAALSGEAPATSRTRELVALPMPPVLREHAGSAGLWPLLADSALAATAEALARTGRQVDTARFVAALDTLHGFAPRPGLSLGFSPRQRHGFDVSYLWKEGPDEAHPSPRH